MLFLVWILLASIGVSVALWFPWAGARRVLTSGYVFPRLIARVRLILFLALIIGLSASFLITHSYWPYPSVRGEDKPVFYVEVVGRQFSWYMNSTKVPADVLVAFLVTSADVNHGFGIYDEKTGKLIAQVQAMPGYVNELIVTLKPGKYRIVCMEYCGIGHPLMVAEIEAIKGYSGG